MKDERFKKFKIVKTNCCKLFRKSKEENKRFIYRMLDDIQEEYELRYPPNRSFMTHVYKWFMLKCLSQKRKCLALYEKETNKLIGLLIYVHKPRSMKEHPEDKYQFECYPWNAKFKICALYIHCMYRNHNLGTYLLDEFEKIISRETKNKYLYYITGFEENFRLRMFFIRNDFKIDGKRHYYSNDLVFYKHKYLKK